jgi:hypothetical protein
VYIYLYIKKTKTKTKTMRKIVIYNTQSGTDFEVTTDSNTWGDLKLALAGSVSKIDSMKAVISHTSGTLEADEAILPPSPTNGEDLTIFLSPMEVKSGV